MQQHHSNEFSDHWKQTTEEVLDEIQRRDIKDAEKARRLREQGTASTPTSSSPKNKVA